MTLVWPRNTRHSLKNRGVAYARNVAQRLTS
jgi:hypothetical protein